MADPKRSDYMRQYMREYMRRRRGLTVKPARTDPEIGPPCPPNLPAGDVTTGRLTLQSHLFKAHLAFALSQQKKIYDEMELEVQKVELKAGTFYNESLEYQMQLTDAEAKVAELEARVVELEAKLAQVSSKPSANLPAVTNLPAATNLPAVKPEKPKPELDQYLRDKAQGFVDPDRKPTPADDHMPDF